MKVGSGLFCEVDPYSDLVRDKKKIGSSLLFKPGHIYECSFETLALNWKYSLVECVARTVAAGRDAAARGHRELCQASPGSGIGSALVMFHSVHNKIIYALEII